jgi:hypothetical protein
MQNIIKKTAAGAVMGGALLFTGGMGLAQAAPPQIQDGLVNLAIGDIAVLNDVEVAAAVQLAAALCDTVDAAVLGAVDETGQAYTCTSEVGDIVVTQNGRGNSENAPGAANRPQG